MLFSCVYNYLYQCINIKLPSQILIRILLDYYYYRNLESCDMKDHESTGV